MSIYRSIPGSSSQVLSLSVRNMLSISLDVSFGKSKIDEEDFVTGFVETDTEVIRFDVSVNKMSVMHILNSCDKLVNNHEH